MNRMFFELIRVAIGTQDDLSHAPSHEEWRTLYALAEKQALMGVCFVGVQRLKKSGHDIPVEVYMTWLGIAAKIQQRNDLLNRRCVEVQRILAEDGMRSSILKGQGVAELYNLNIDLNLKKDDNRDNRRQL